MKNEKEEKRGVGRFNQYEKQIGGPLDITAMLLTLSHKKGTDEERRGVIKQTGGVNRYAKGAGHKKKSLHTISKPPQKELEETAKLKGGKHEWEETGAFLRGYKCNNRKGVTLQT